MTNLEVVTLTQLRDAAHAGSQEGLFQGPQLQLGIGISPLVVTQGSSIVGTEVGREGEDTCGGNRANRSRKEAHGTLSKAQSNPVS